MFHFTLNIRQRKYPDKHTLTHSLQTIVFRIKPPCCPPYKRHLRWKIEGKFLFKKVISNSGRNSSMSEDYLKEREREMERVGWRVEERKRDRRTKTERRRRRAREIWRRF